MTMRRPAARGPALGPALALALTLALGGAAGAQAQAILNPNQIVVTTRFTNTDPTIRAFLDSDTSPWSGRLDAVSADRVLDLRSYTETVSWSRTRAGQEVTVESSEVGIAYDVRARQRRGGDRIEHYYFAETRSEPVQALPAAGVPLDVAECAALVHVCFRNGAGIPVTVETAEITVWPHDPAATWAYNTAQALVRVTGVTEVSLAARALGAATVRIDVTTGSDPNHDTVTLRREFQVNLECDRGVDIGCTGEGFCEGGGSGLGIITGRFDVLGEDEADAQWLDRTTVVAYDGPFGNGRVDPLTAPPWGAFELENLLPSGSCLPGQPYRVRANYALRSGRQVVYAHSPEVSVLVEPDSTTDLGDAFVMTPSHVVGAVALAGPPPVPFLGAPIEHLLHVDDPYYDSDGDGLVDWVGGACNGTRVGASRVGTGFGHACTGIVGSSSLPSGAFAGHYDLVLARPAPPDVWDAGSWTVASRSVATPDVPLSYLSGKFNITDGGAAESVLAPPGSTVTVDRDACLGLVRVTFLATSGTLSNPVLSVANYDQPRLDWLGHALDRSVRGNADGTPADARYPEPVGLVQALVPEGKYVLAPTMMTRSPDGTSSITEVLPVSLTVSCRQVVDALPDLGVSLAALPACADEGPLPVWATVASSHAIARAWAKADGGPDVEICANCGFEPVLETTLQLLPGEHSVSVHVVDDEGREASATQAARLLREPSDLVLHPGVEPLRVVRRGDAELTLTWENLPGQPCSVYRGTIASLHAGVYDHAGFGACGVTDARLDTPLPAAGAYFLVAGACDWGDTLTGRDSAGRLHPGAIDRCR